jgi:hypothetical protein
MWHKGCTSFEADRINTQICMWLFILKIFCVHDCTFSVIIGLHHWHEKECFRIQILFPVGNQCWYHKFLLDILLMVILRCRRICLFLISQSKVQIKRPVLFVTDLSANHALYISCTWNWHIFVVKSIILNTSLKNIYIYLHWSLFLDFIRNWLL